MAAMRRLTGGSANPMRLKGKKSVPGVPMRPLNTTSHLAGGMAPHPATSPAVQNYMNRLMRPQMGKAATANPLGGGQAQMLMRGAARPPTPPPREPPEAQPGGKSLLSDTQATRLARLQQRQGAGKDVNQARLEKLLGMLRGTPWTGGSTKPKPGEGPPGPPTTAEEETPEQLAKWAQNLISGYDVWGTPAGPAGWSKKDLEDIIRAALAAGIGRKGIAMLLGQVGAHALAGPGTQAAPWSKDPSTGGPLSYLMENPEQMKAVVQWMNRQGYGQGFQEEKWTEYQSDLFNQFPNLWAAYVGALGPGAQAKILGPIANRGVNNPADLQAKWDAYVAMYGIPEGMTWNTVLAQEDKPTTPTTPMASNFQQQYPSINIADYNGIPGLQGGEIENAQNKYEQAQAQKLYGQNAALGGRGTEQWGPGLQSAPQQQGQVVPRSYGQDVPNPPAGTTTTPGVTYSPPSPSPTYGWQTYAQPSTGFTAPAFNTAGYQQAAAQMGQAFNGIPLSGEMEAGRRVLEDQLSAALAAAGYSWDQIGAIMQVLLARLGTQQAQATQAVNEDFAARGGWGSGAMAQGVTQSNLDFARQRQDAMMNAQQQYTDVQNQALEAYQGYGQGIMDLLLQLAQLQAQSPSPTLPITGKGKGKGGKKGGK